MGRQRTDGLEPEVESVRVLDGLDALLLEAEVLADQPVSGGDAVLAENLLSGRTDARNLRE